LHTARSRDLHLLTSEDSRGYDHLHLHGLRLRGCWYRSCHGHGKGRLQGRLREWWLVMQLLSCEGSCRQASLLHRH
jgi:hypothetical protein